MSTQDTIEHLRLGREGLVRQRDEIDDAISGIDRVLAQLGYQAPETLPVASPAAAPDSPSGPPPPREEPDDTPAEAADDQRDEPVATPEPTGPTAREGIFELLNRNGGRPMAVSEIIAALPEVGVTAKVDTIRALIIKMSKANQIKRVERGLYRLPPRRPASSPRVSAQPELAPTDSEGPVSAGPSDDNAPTTDTGGDPHVQDRSNGHHRDHDFARLDGDRGQGGTPTS